MGNLGSVKLNLAVCYTAFLEDYAHRNLEIRPGLFELERKYDVDFD